MHPGKLFNYSWLLAVTTLVFATATNGYVAYDPYFGPIELPPAQYRFNPWYRYMLPRVSSPSSSQLTRSDDITIPEPVDISHLVSAWGKPKNENDTVPTVSFFPGQPAQREELPGLVTLVSTYTFYGTGTLITRRHVLTAGHVALSMRNNQNLETLRALINAGALFFPYPNTEIRSIVDIYIHPDIQSVSSFWKNDIAVLRLNSPVTNVPRVHLSFDDIDFQGQSYLSYSLGYSQSTYTMMKAELTMASNSICSATYGNTALLNDQYLCLETSQITCGDDGAPLMKNGMQFGVASKASACTSSPVPAVYMRIGAFADWITHWIDL